jgi:uncharacterized membrane protein
MNTPHVHLLLNHVPTVGTVIAFGLLLLALLRQDNGLKRAALEVFYVVALLTLPTYLSGVGTQMALEQTEGVVKEVVERHSDAALVASLFMLLTGGMSWLTLWQWRRLSRPRAGSVMAVLVLGVITLALMARAANFGGDIRHPEIVAAGGPAAVASTGFLTAAGVQQFVTGKTWVWPMNEALHFIGLWLLFGIVLLINLRMLGVMKGVSFQAVHRMLPWAVLGLGLNTVTGMSWVLAAPGQYLQNIAFFWKMGLLLFAGLDVLYLTAFEGPWKVEANEDAPVLRKTLAATAIVLWIGVMYFGRMLPFIGNAF